MMQQTPQPAIIKPKVSTPDLEKSRIYYLCSVEEYQNIVKDMTYTEYGECYKAIKRASEEEAYMIPQKLYEKLIKLNISK